MARRGNAVKKRNGYGSSVPVGGGAARPVTAVRPGRRTPVPAARADAPAARGGASALGAVVMSPWGWRIMAVFALLAVGLCMTFFLDGRTAFGGLWALISLAWSAFAWKLWRMHLDWDTR